MVSSFRCCCCGRAKCWANWWEGSNGPEKVKEFVARYQYLGEKL